MNEKKKEIAREIFSPVIKKFQRIQIQTHYKDECWSIDLIDRSSLSKYNKNYKFIFTIQVYFYIFVERFKRTLLDLIKEPMYIEGKACWLNHINTFLNKYNNRVHGTTKMTPFEMSTN